MNPRIADLPSTIYLLPMDGFLLLPEGALPLSLTSPLRRRILEAAEDDAGGWVGVIQGLSSKAGKISREFDVGCLAHITPLGRTEAGHHLVLEGVIRFRVRKDLPDSGGLPRASVSYEEFARDLDPVEEEIPGLDLDAFKEQLVSFGRDRFGTAGILEDMTPREVVQFMMQTSPFRPAERQALLEARDFRERLSILLQLLAINFLTTTPDASPQAH
jgi:Lon protease-like protein